MEVVVRDRIYFSNGELATMDTVSLPSKKLLAMLNEYWFNVVFFSQGSQRFLNIP